MTPTKAVLEITKDEYTRTLFDEEGKVIARERMVRQGRGSFKGMKADRVELPDEEAFHRLGEDFEELDGMDMAQGFQSYIEWLEEGRDEDENDGEDE